MKFEFSHFFSFFKKQAKATVSSKAMQSALQKKQRHLPFDFDQWYTKLKDHTFESEILSIKPEVALAMKHYYGQKFLHRHQLTEKDMQLLIELEQHIQKVLDTKFANQKVFVRMSDRSPKDGLPLLKENESIESTFEKAIADLDQANPNYLNSKMIRLTEAQMQLLQCQNAKEVLNLLLSSERVFEDLSLALECKEFNADDQWLTSIIVRQWQPDLREDMEFRLFVYEGQINAITQYNPYCVYPSLANKTSEELNTLSNKMVTFAKQIHPLIEQKSYILDIAIINGEPKVIELNPFDPSTGPGLFSWQNDKQLLTSHGYEHPVFKIRKEECPNLEGIMEIMLDSYKNNEDVMHTSYNEDFASSHSVHSHR